MGGEALTRAGRVAGRGSEVVDARDKGEQGRIALLVIGLIVIVLAFVLMAAGISAVHIQDRRLMSCADRVAAAASGVIDADAFFGGSLEGQVISPSPGGAHSAAQDALADLADSTCRVGLGVELVSVEVQSNQAVVTLRARAVLPVVPPMLTGVVAPALVTASAARTS